MKSKGCLNPECEVYQKKVYFSDADNFCPKCGRALETVCQYKKCYKPINPGQKYCAIHEAEINDRRDQALDTLGKVGTAIVSIGGTVITLVSNGKINLPTKKS